MRLRIVTFNVENLTSRSRFGANLRPETAPALSLFDAPTLEAREAVQRAIAIAQEDDKRQLTALAIAQADADVLLLQEVDNLGVLEAFLANYVAPVTHRRYGHARLVNGNDPRGIDVAFAACEQLVARSDQITVVSHKEEAFGELGVYDETLAQFGIGPDDRVFNRDCLEVFLDFGGWRLSIYVCHFKAISEGRPDARLATAPLRRAEARAVRHLVERRFEAETAHASWLVAGDLNDYSERILPGGHAEASAPSSLEPLLEFSVNPMRALPPHERWTYFKGRPDPREGGEHVQLDYVLLSPGLARNKRPVRVELVRSGLPYRVPLDPRETDRTFDALCAAGGRFPRVGWDRPKASDHCPLVVEFEVPDD